jgi:hypothetical protein
MVPLLGALVAMFALSGSAAAGFGLGVTGSLTLESDAGDWVGQGQTYSLATPDAGFATHSDGTTVQLLANTWDLKFAAPVGQRLLPGTYPGATRAPFRNAGEPGLEISSETRGCNTVDGDFTVLEATYGPYGYLQSFHATFEQHCDGLQPALRGEINVTSAPAPEPVAVRLTLDPAPLLVRGGGIEIHGTVSCNQAVPYFVPISVTATEMRKTTSVGSNTTGVDWSCPTTLAPWSVTVYSDSKPNFSPGAVTLTASTSVPDDYYSQYFDYNPFINATASLTQTVKVKEG